MKRLLYISLGTFLLTTLARAQSQDTTKSISYDSTETLTTGQQTILTENYLLKGTIGSQQIIMSLKIFNDEISEANYFYVSQLKDIHLEGTKIKSKIKLHTFNGDSSVYERFEVIAHSNEIVGYWTNGSKTFPVKLKRANVNEFSTPYRATLSNRYLKEYPNSMLFIKMSFIRFAKDSSSQNGAAIVDWYKEKRTGISLPRIVKGYSATTLKRINSKLLEIHLEQVFNSLVCYDHHRTNLVWNMKVNHLYCHKTVFSLNLYIEYYCGGAHGDWGWDNYSFDGSNGKQLVFDELLWFSKNKPPVENANGHWGYRDSVVAPKLIEIFEHLYPKEMNNDNCGYFDTEYWGNPIWYFTKKGLYVGAKRYRSPCSGPEWSIIPYRHVKKIMNPNSKFKLP